MIEIKQILCAIDFSEFSSRALEHAVAFARWYQAGLTVLHVVPNLPAMDLPPRALAEKDRKRLMDEMQKFSAPVPQDLSLDLRLREAPDVHREILDNAEALHTDLVVLGSHGRSGFEKLFLGSVTEKVLRKAECPVLIVPTRAKNAAPDRVPVFRKMLCPVDFSDGSIKALRWAVGLADKNHAQLSVLHVMAVLSEEKTRPDTSALDIDTGIAAEASRLKRVTTLVAEEARNICTIKTHIREGLPYRQILEMAVENDSDLIVMGRQGSGSIDRIFFGSNTARVARTSTCPVLIVRGENAKV